MKQLCHLQVDELVVTDTSLPNEPVPPIAVAKTLHYMDHVWVYWSTRKKDLLPKLGNHWVGPCKLLK